MRYIIIITTLFVFTSFSYAQNYQIIINISNSTSSLSRTDISAFLLKKKTKWADNTKVAPVDLSSKSSVRGDFSKAIHKKSTSQVRAFWQQSVFSGKATPPREMKDDAAVIAFVKSNKGAIGYISASTAADGVKVISVN